MLRLALAALMLTVCAAPVGAQASSPAAAAFAAGADGDWDAAYALIGTDPLARDLLTWTRLRDGDGTFGDYLAFVAARPDWPGMDRLRARGEEVIEKGTDPQLILRWFAGQTPQTGEGATRLAEALYATGNGPRAATVLREAWLGLGLSDEGHAAMMEAFPDVLRPWHAGRTDAMLWRWRTSDATRMLPLLAPDARALAAARIAYITGTGVDAAVKAVPQALRNDPGLAYDRYNWLAGRGRNSEAIALLLARTDDPAKLVQPWRWAGWRRQLARFDMRQGNYDEAYKLASHHHLTPDDGESYADLEWLSGYIALRFLHDPATALRHFDALEAAVDSPISEGRAGYWVGRAADALGDGARADAAYTRAAANQTSFYGLLAAEKMGIPLSPALAGSETFPDWHGAAFLNSDITRAGLTLLSAGERGSAVLFFSQLAKGLDRTELGQLGAMFDQMHESFFELMIAKSAVTRGIVIPSMYFPLHDLARKDVPVPRELALAIARRESEFNESVGSPVGALGLMQLMPGTAQDVARDLGLPYSRARLTSDWDYNATLGSAYLAQLEQRFGYSPVMIAAGYNAGPARPDQWIAENGDPRTGDVDIVDWIEAIPFAETRNYVQRVTEAIPIYQARLTGRAGPIHFTDLLRGVKPVIRPQARPDRTATAATPAVPAAGSPAAAETSPVPPMPPPAPPGIRPLARPGG